MRDIYDIVIKRTDFNKTETIIPFQIGMIKRAVEAESEGHRRATSPSMSLTFYSSDLERFLTPFPLEAEYIQCEISHYIVFEEDDQHLVFVGVANELPTQKVMFNNETVTIEFTTVVLTWGSGSDIKDGDDYYRFLRVDDALLLFDAFYKVQPESAI